MDELIAPTNAMLDTINFALFFNMLFPMDGYRSGYE